MLLNPRCFLAVFLLSASVHAQQVPEPAPPPDRNHVFFHPVLTGLSLAISEAPFLLPVTFERNLAAPSVSLVYQPVLILGDSEMEGESGEENFKVTQYGLSNTLGLRRYFNGLYRGFYLQASGRFEYTIVGVEGAESGAEADLSLYRLGALAFFGYRWTHVFLDLGGGFGTANGTATLDNGDEVELAASGPLLDFNLGFGF